MTLIIRKRPEIKPKNKRFIDDETSLKQVSVPMVTQCDPTSFCLPLLQTILTWIFSYKVQSSVLTSLFVWSWPSIPLCTLINQHLSGLARKFPQTKFLRSISTTCIPSYPDRNLPTIFVYFEGEMKAQFIGPLVFGGMNLKVEGRAKFFLFIYFLGFSRGRKLNYLCFI